MGCGSSREEASILAPGRPLEDWSADEVFAWFSSLAHVVQKYRDALLPEEGCFAAKWTTQYLRSKGLPDEDAAHVLCYRDKAAAGSASAGRVCGDKASAGEAGLAVDRTALRSWGVTDVSAWYATLVPDMQKFRHALLPEDGAFLAQWSTEYLVGKGLPEADAERLLTYRDKAATAAAARRDSGGGGKGATPRDAYLPPGGEAFEDWETWDVSSWYGTLVPDMQQYRGVLLPEMGCFVVKWDQQYLVGKGLPDSDAARLLAYRDKALAAAERVRVEREEAAAMAKVLKIGAAALNEQVVVCAAALGDMPPRGTPFGDEWSTKEITLWYNELPLAGLYRDTLLPSTGKAVAKWTLEGLVAKGVPEGDAARLIAYRDNYQQPLKR